jgi:hypothetical protein
MQHRVKVELLVVAVVGVRLAVKQLLTLVVPELLADLLMVQVYLHQEVI